MLIKAFILASQAHKGQRDKGGRAHIMHSVKVALNLKGIKRKTVALLHDTVEDTSATLETLKKQLTIKFLITLIQSNCQ